MVTNWGYLVYNPNKLDATDAIVIAAMTMKKYYDQKHKAEFFKVGDFVMLRLRKGYTIPSAKLMTKKLQQQFGGRFEITERIGKLACRLHIPSNWKIHPFVTVAQIEPSFNPEKDPYKRQIKLSRSVMVGRVIE